MPVTKARVNDSILIVIDEQPSFMRGIWEADRVVVRTEFLLQAAVLLEVPVLATEQYPDRMGATDPRVSRHLHKAAIGKMAFSAWGAEEFMLQFKALERSQA